MSKVLNPTRVRFTTVKHLRDFGNSRLLLTFIRRHDGCTQCLTDDIYTNVLQNKLPALLKDILPNTGHHIYCQHDEQHVNFCRGAKMGQTVYAGRGLPF